MNVLRDIIVRKVQGSLYSVHSVILLTLQDKLSVQYVRKDGELSSSTLNIVSNLFYIFLIKAILFIYFLYLIQEFSWKFVCCLQHM